MSSPRPLEARSVTRSDEPATLTPGRYQVVINHDGATLALPQVEIEPGKLTRLTGRFGALKLTFPRSALRVIDGHGNMLAIARPYQTVHLPPGSYRLLDGTRQVDQIDVHAGDISLVTP